MSVLINLAFIVMGYVGFYRDVELLSKLFLISCYVIVISSPFTLIVTILAPFMKKVPQWEIWVSRITDIVMVIILADHDHMILATLVVIQMVLLEIVFRIRNE